MPRWKDLVITDHSKIAITTQDAIETVHDVPGAIGFGPFTRTLEAKTTVIRVDGRYPTDVEYPSGVILALIYKKARITPAARTFITYLGTERARVIFQNFGSVPMKKIASRLRLGWRIAGRFFFPGKPRLSRPGWPRRLQRSDWVVEAAAPASPRGT